MTVSLRAAGTPTAATAAVTAINPSPPSGWQSGDLSLLIVDAKSTTTSGNAPTCATPSGWTPCPGSPWFGAGSATPANDAGPGKAFVFYRTDSPSAPGNLSFTNVNSASAVIVILQKTLTDWDLTAVNTVLDDTSSGVNYAPGAGSTIALAAGDYLIGAHYHSSDGGTISAETQTVPGCTLGTLAIIDRAVTTGFDHRLRVVHRTVTAGSASGAPTHTYTTLQGGTAFTAFFRVRDVNVVTGTLATALGGSTLAAAGTETIPGTLATTLAGATLAGSGEETIPGTLAATLEGATLAAAGTETLTGTLAATLAGATLAAAGQVVSPITGALAVTLGDCALAAVGDAPASAAEAGPPPASWRSARALVPGT